MEKVFAVPPHPKIEADTNVNTDYVLSDRKA